MDRKEVIEEIRERVMLHAGKIGEKGKKHVLKTLTDTSDPWKSIREIQSSFGLGFPECDPAIQFLRALKMNSSSIHVRIFEELKEQLTTSLLDLSQENLLIMLNETIAFLSIEELKIVPISIMRQLSNIPDKYLGLLVSKGFISEFPFSVKCKAWELNSPYFIKYIDDHVGNYTKSAEDKSNSDSKIKQISTIISTSEKLFRTFCDHCVLKSCKESREWGGLLGKVLVKAQEMGKKLKSEEKLHDLAWLLSRCKRQKTIDYSTVNLIYNTLKSLIIAQTAALEKTYQQEYERYLEQTRVQQELKRKERVNGKRKSEDSERVIVKRSKVEVPQNVLQPILTEGWQFVSDNDVDFIFAEKVTDAMVPGYSSIISKPMYLSLIKRKIDSGKYLSLSALHEDMMRMFNNCSKFNGPLSTFTKYGKDLQALWSEKYEELKQKLSKNDTSSQPSAKPLPQAHTPKEIVKPKPSQKDLNPSGTGQRTHPAAEEVSAARSAKIEFSELEKAPQLLVRKLERLLEAFPPLSRLFSDQFCTLLNLCVEFLSCVDKYQLFAKPVTDLIAPGYSSQIKRKIALSNMRQKISKNQYKTIYDFDADVELLVGNCLSYNHTGDAIYQAGEHLIQAWALFYEIIINSENSAKSSKPTQETTPTQEETPMEVSEEPFLEPSKDVSSSGTYSVDGAVIKIPRILTVQEIEESLTGLEALEDKINRVMTVSCEFLSDFDPAGYFASPVVAVDYSTVVEQPIDMSLIGLKIDRNKYKGDLSAFQKDLELMFNNCFSYNEVYSDVYKTAEEMRFAWDLSYQNILSVINEDPSLAVTLQDTHRKTASIDIAATAGKIDQNTKIEEKNETAKPNQNIETKNKPTQDEDKPTDNKNKPTKKEDKSTKIEEKSTENENKPIKDKQTKGEALEKETHKKSSEGDSETHPPASESKLTLKTKNPDSKTGLTPEPSAPVPETLVKPVPSAELVYSRKVVERLKQPQRTGVGVPTTVDLPQIIGKTRLMGAVILLREPVIQTLLVKQLVGRLSDWLVAQMNVTIQAVKKHQEQGGKTAGMDNPNSLQKLRVSLPFEERAVRLTFQLCQLSRSTDLLVPETDETVLRLLIPLVLKDVLDSKKKGIPEKGSGKTHVEIVRGLLEKTEGQVSLVAGRTKHSVFGKEREVLREFLEEVVRLLLDDKSLII